MRITLVKIAFVALALWWVYLFFTSEFLVVYDSEGYETSGQTIAYHGWAEFMRHGPQREPQFIGLVALSMRLGDWWGISYHYPLKMIGLLFLSLTMFFSYRLMGMLGVNRWVAYIFVLYLGISPTMSTSCMRLWSEFAAYPWVVLSVIWTIKSWNFLDNASDDRRENIRIVGYAAMVAFMFLGVMSVKAITEGVIALYLWPFYWRTFLLWRLKNIVKARQVALFFISVLIIFEGAVCAYRASNYHYNGHFAVTSRGDWAFYGNTTRRLQPLTLKRLGAAVLMVPPFVNCASVFEPGDCNFWTARFSDDLIGLETNKLTARGITGDAASKYFINSSLKLILSHPLQEVLLMFIEAHKMFFWEPITSFEIYPAWVGNIFFLPLFFKTTMIVVAFLSWAGCVFAFIYLCRRCRKPSGADKKERAAVLWVFNFVFWYMAFYSLYFILDRYSYPLASLFIVLTAFLVHKITRIFFHETSTPNS